MSKDWIDVWLDACEEGLRHVPGEFRLAQPDTTVYWMDRTFGAGEKLSDCKPLADVLAQPDRSSRQEVPDQPHDQDDHDGEDK